MKINGPALGEKLTKAGVTSWWDTKHWCRMYVRFCTFGLQQHIADFKLTESRLPPQKMTYSVPKQNVNFCLFSKGWHSLANNLQNFSSVFLNLFLPHFVASAWWCRNTSHSTWLRAEVWSGPMNVWLFTPFSQSEALSALIGVKLLHLLISLSFHLWCLRVCCQPSLA